MEAVNRRTTLALGLTTAATPLIAWATPAAAQTYAPEEGEEIAPGVRVVAIGERTSVIPAYAMVKLRDVVIQPGAKTPDNVMKNDMACHMTEGELSVVQNKKQFTVKKGDVWTCAKADNRRHPEHEQFGCDYAGHRFDDRISEAKCGTGGAKGKPVVFAIECRTRARRDRG